MPPATRRDDAVQLACSSQLMPAAVQQMVLEACTLRPAGRTLIDEAKSADFGADADRPAPRI